MNSYQKQVLKNQREIIRLLKPIETNTCLTIRETTLKKAKKETLKEMEAALCKLAAEPSKY